MFISPEFVTDDAPCLYGIYTKTLFGMKRVGEIWNNDEGWYSAYSAKGLPQRTAEKDKQTIFGPVESFNAIVAKTAVMTCC